MSTETALRVVQTLTRTLVVPISDLNTEYNELMDGDDPDFTDDPHEQLQQLIDSEGDDWIVDTFGVEDLEVTTQQVTAE